MKTISQRKKFSRKTSHRLAMIRNLAISLIEKEQILTTVEKAKNVAIFVERLRTIASRCIDHPENYVTIIRKLKDKLHNEMAAKKLIDVISRRYADRIGSATRVIRMNHRHGDCAEMAVVEFIDGDYSAKFA